MQICTRFFFQGRIFRFHVGCPRMTLLYINYQCVRLATRICFFYFDVDILKNQRFLKVSLFCPRSVLRYLSNKQRNHEGQSKGTSFNIATLRPGDLYQSGWQRGAPQDHAKGHATGHTTSCCGGGPP